jgi:hypothetical protein
MNAQEYQAIDFGFAFHQGRRAFLPRDNPNSFYHRYYQRMVNRCTAVFIGLLCLFQTVLTNSITQVAVLLLWFAAGCALLFLLLWFVVIALPGLYDWLMGG